MKPPPQGVVASKATLGGPHLLCILAQLTPPSVCGAGGGSTGSEQVPGSYAGKARTKESPIKTPEPPMGGASGSGQSSAMDVDNEGSRGDGKKNMAPKEAAKAPKGAVPSPTMASQPGAQCGFWDATLISDVRDRDRDISDNEYSPTNVCMFPSWEDAMPSSVTTAPRDFEQFRTELMGIQKILDSPALVDLDEVDLDELGEPPREYISDEDFEGHVEDDGIGAFVAKFSGMESRDLIPSKQEPPYYEAKAWRTTEEEIGRMKHLFPLFRAENYRQMAEGSAPTGAKAHESGLLPVGASLEDAAMVNPPCVQLRALTILLTKVRRSCWTPRAGHIAESPVLLGMVSSGFSPRSPTQQWSPDDAPERHICF